MTAWSVHFGWPAGDVYGNLIASGICAAAAIWRIRIHLRRHTRHQAQQHAQTRDMIRQLNENLRTDPSKEDRP